MKIWLHKLKNWEYWSVNVVYLPTFLLWIWYAIKFRSFSFYKDANPGIHNGGLYGDSKFEIYKFLPKGMYPKTVLIEINQNQDIEQVLLENHLSFPLIAKPDDGYRGIAVQKVHSLNELNNYQKNMDKKFLIQENIEYPNEIGLFYVRMPNENHGKITGITVKKFLTVEGNGQDTLEQLLKNKPRFEMQIPKLRDKLNLHEILPKGEKKCLVPYGNHNRGTEFLDGQALITEKLEQTFDGILKNIQGFYYGRLDIRYQTFEALEEGRDFSIIELNGAKSEPTHIYDPKHSFWYGQLEILKHQSLFMQIIRVVRDLPVLTLLQLFNY